METIDNNIIFCFWTGTNPMSAQRRLCLENMRNTTECIVKLIDVNNLAEYVLPEAPLHAAYPFLSEVHKADYLRTYFMHYYGGGYSDIKLQTGGWLDAFEDMRASDAAVLNGYHEDGPWCVGIKEVRPSWARLPGNGAYIVRPRTDFTERWYTTLLKLLDSKLERLKAHPATHPRCVEQDGTGYPFYWQELLGSIFHVVSHDYMDRLLFTVPKPVITYTSYA